MLSQSSLHGKTFKLTLVLKHVSMMEWMPRQNMAAVCVPNIHLGFSRTYDSYLQLLTQIC